MTSHVEEEILRLKRKLVRDDAQGHSCEQCRHITLKLIPLPATGLKREREHSFRLDTTVAEVRDLAASGCNLWAMIRDKLALLELEEKVQGERGNVKFDSTKYERWWSDAHYKDLAASVGGDVEREFWHLRKSPVFWGFSAGAGYEMDFSVTQEEFVRVIIRYSSLNGFKGSSVSAEVVLIVPARPVSKVLSPDRGDSGIQMAKHWTSLWALSSPGDLANSTRACVGSPINLNPGSSASITLYRHWLQKCETCHSCGINDLPRSMPSLALDVAATNSVRLIQVPTAMKERYVALSYCWGTDVQTTMLTQGIKNDLFSGISLERLDPTIRDSVTVTRELGFRLLWIDALCIFQDDEESKRRELGIMGKIYQNATFTIVVSAANNVKDGFLHRRRSTLDRVGFVDGHPQPIFKFRAESSGGGKEKPVILRPHSLDKIEPWYERAWTLQEMLFSRRRLQFRDSQTTWLCHCIEPPAQECDGWLAGTDHNYTGYSDSYFEATMTMMRSANNSANVDEALSNWYDLVEVYSSRKLRYFDDRLPAISGIAREFASILQDGYICGLWKADLAIGLVWFPIQPRHPVSGVKSGPSWSWASYEGQATWWTHKCRKWRPNQDFEILNDVTELRSSSSPFGEVKKAELRVSGLLLPTLMPVREEYNNIHIYLEGARAAVVLEYPDDPRVQPDSGRKLSLLVLVNLDWVGVEGIVLLEEEEDRYSRVGWFDVEDVWPVTKWVKMRDRTPKSQEELQERLRSLWGGKQNIRQFTLI
ncbi:HET-domain-containing protein [Lophiostoma macrostomum CBS 122681]|uniref:HET-domain-containing protein n=1 Tax=Lophiostoma macrostomum CBS 122681 TaxID=1314788 RepID=A0A6A6SPF6_9PLEO|nr:HET-domain-containing protein [Lophiostoma macrostomum CBS 122681]